MSRAGLSQVDNDRIEIRDASSLPRPPSYPGGPLTRGSRHGGGSVQEGKPRTHDEAQRVLGVARRRTTTPTPWLRNHPHPLAHNSFKLGLPLDPVQLVAGVEPQALTQSRRSCDRALRGDRIG
jgi:hypothetical protein